MAVYVDQPLLKYGRMIMCHMAADSIDELNEMADSIGVNRRWLQQADTRPHYDICKSKRALAVSRGAIEVPPRDIVRIINTCRC